MGRPKSVRAYWNKFCACGCDGQFRVDNWYSYKRYIGNHGHIGKVVSPEGGANMSRAQKGRKRRPTSQETRDKIGAANRGKSRKRKPHTQVTKDKISASLWRGGLAQMPYPFNFNESLKKLIRERDGRTCQLCDRTREEEGKNLVVHHIDYIKENLDPNNLITLCCRCNSKVNSGRKYWTRFFLLKLKIA